MLRKFLNIGTVENSVFIELLFIIGDVSLIAYCLQNVYLRLDSLVAPFKCVKAMSIIVVVFKT